MHEACNGDRVTVHYTGRLPDGSVFDSSKDHAPIDVVIGAGAFLAGFEAAIIGMRIGERRVITIPSVHAYGDRLERLVQTVDRSELSEDLDIAPGRRLAAEEDNGVMRVLTITAMDETTVTLDANHPLAGLDLEFEIELIDLQPAPVLAKPFALARAGRSGSARRPNATRLDAARIARGRAQAESAN